MEAPKKSVSLDKALLRIIIACACLLVPAGAAAFYLLRSSLPDKFAQGYVAGSVLGLANMYFLILVVVSVVNAAGVRAGPVVAGLLGVNATVFGMLFVAWKHWVGTLGIAAGFTLSLVVVVAGVLFFSKRTDESA